MNKSKGNAANVPLRFSIGICAAGLVGPEAAIVNVVVVGKVDGRRIVAFSSEFAAVFAA